MNSFNRLVRDAFTAAGEAEESVDLGEFARAFITAHPDDTERAVTDLIVKAVTDIARRMAGERNDGNVQLSLFPGIPQYICVGRNKYKARGKTTLADLEYGLVERDDNVKAATEARDQYANDIDRVRPYMQEHPERTLDEVAEIMAAEDEDMAE